MYRKSVDHVEQQFTGKVPQGRHFPPRSNALNQSSSEHALVEEERRKGGKEERNTKT